MLVVQGWNLEGFVGSTLDGMASNYNNAATAVSSVVASPGAEILSETYQPSTHGVGWEMVVVVVGIKVGAGEGVGVGYSLSYRAWPWCIPIWTLLACQHTKATRSTSSFRPPERRAIFCFVLRTSYSLFRGRMILTSTTAVYCCVFKSPNIPCGPWKRLEADHHLRLAGLVVAVAELGHVAGKYHRVHLLRDFSIPFVIARRRTHSGHIGRWALLPINHSPTTHLPQTTFY